MIEFIFDRVSQFYEIGIEIVKSKEIEGLIIKFTFMIEDKVYLVENNDRSYLLYDQDNNLIKDKSQIKNIMNWLFFKMP